MIFPWRGPKCEKETRSNPTVTIMDIFAIGSVLLGRSEAMCKLIWIALILLLPVVGMGLYFLIGRSAADAHA